MTSAAGPTYLQTLTDAERANELVMWQAAQTVRHQITDPDDQYELLGTLGLRDVQRPVGLP